MEDRRTAAATAAGPGRRKNSGLQRRRWGRFVGRFLIRAVWHWRGLLLWLVRRPRLRCLPLPYPAVRSRKEYQE
eukprot:4028622-Lingulodinium_polyedra.AAC.1